MPLSTEAILSLPNLPLRATQPGLWFHWENDTIWAWNTHACCPHLPPSRLGAHTVPPFLHPLAHSAILPHLIAPSVPHINTLKSQVKRNTETTMLPSICASNTEASDKSLLVSLRINCAAWCMPPCPGNHSQPRDHMNEPQVHKPKSPSQFLLDLPSPQHLTFGDFHLESLWRWFLWHHRLVTPLLHSVLQSNLTF